MARGAGIMAAVLVVPISVAAAFRREVVALLIVLWWQPLVLPYVTALSADGHRIPHPVRLAFLQWGTVLLGFSFLCGRLTAWQQVLLAVATMIGVGVVSILAMPHFGYTFYFDGP